MGYSDITMLGSDLSAYLFEGIVAATANRLEKALKEQGNSYNTSGAVNVGLVFEEVITPNMGAWGKSPKLKDVASRALNQLESEIKATEEWDWEDETSKKYHIERYREIRRALMFYVEAG